MNLVDDSLVTAGVINFLRAVADLSEDGSNSVGLISVGDHQAPTIGTNSPVLAEIDIVAGTMKPYLVVYQTPVGFAPDRGARSGYAGGTPATRVLRYTIAGLALHRDPAQRVAATAAGRICETDANGNYTNIDVGQYEDDGGGNRIFVARPGLVEIGRRERIGHGALDRVGELFQWTELIELDVALAS